MEYLTSTDVLGASVLVTGVLFIIVGIMWWEPSEEEDEDVKYGLGDLVWLGEFDNGREVIPRQKAVILCYENGMYIGIVNPENIHDDGLREFSEDQIESAIPFGGL